MDNAGISMECKIRRCFSQDTTLNIAEYATALYVQSLLLQTSQNRLKTCHACATNVAKFCFHSAAPQVDNYSDAGGRFLAESCLAVVASIGSSCGGV